jgi:hypothetical protein
MNCITSANYDDPLKEIIMNALLRNTLADRLTIPVIGGALAEEPRGVLNLGDGTIIEKWLYTTEPGSRVPANLYRPQDITGCVPAIVMTCGHGDSKSLSHMQYVARIYARSGVACLLADPLGEEERHPVGLLGTREHDEQTVIDLCVRRGRSVMGKLVFDAMRGIDFLETFNWVDRSRLGVVGNSLGGAVAGWLYALEPRLRMTIVSGWAFGDYMCHSGKHCTNWPNQQMRSVCDWPALLRLGAENGTLMVMNGDADVIIDRDGSGVVWQELKNNLQEVDPSGRHLQIWWCSDGGHRPYQGNTSALRFIHEQLGTPGITEAEIAALPELIYGKWCDEHKVGLEPLYGVELHYRGVILPDFGFEPIKKEDLAVLNPNESGSSDFTTDGWLRNT